MKKIRIIKVEAIAALLLIAIVLYSCQSSTQQVEEFSVQETVEEVQQDIHNQPNFNKVAGIYLIDMGYVEEYQWKEPAIEIKQDGRCVFLKRGTPSNVIKTYIGDVRFNDDGSFQIINTNFDTDAGKQEIAFYHTNVDEDGPSMRNPYTYVSNMVFEKTSYGLLGFENVSSYRNRDISDYYYAKLKSIPSFN